MSEYLWMEVTRDKLELAIVVVDSPEELAEIAGVSIQNVRASERYGRLYKKKRSRFCKVEVRETE